VITTVEDEDPADNTDGLLVLAALAVPEARRALVEALQQAADQTLRALLDPEVWQGLATAVIRTLADPEFWRQAALVAAEQYSAERLREPIAVARHHLPEADQPTAAHLAAIGQARMTSTRFETSLAQAGSAQPTPDNETAIEAFLTSRGRGVQITLLGTAVTLFAALVALAEEAELDFSHALVVLGAVIQVLGNLLQAREP
jgi:predicted small integral membrane protein